MGNIDLRYTSENIRHIGENCSQVILKYYRSNWLHDIHQWSSKSLQSEKNPLIHSITINWVPGNMLFVRQYLKIDKKHKATNGQKCSSKSFRILICNFKKIFRANKVVLKLTTQQTLNIKTKLPPLHFMLTSYF